MRSLLIGNALTITTMFAWWLFRDFDYKVDIFLFSSDSEYPKFIVHDLGLLVTNTVLYFSLSRVIDKNYKPVVNIFLYFSIFRILEYMLFHGDTDMLPVASCVFMAVLISVMYIKPAR